MQTGGSNSRSARYLQHLAWPAAAKKHESRGPGRDGARGWAVRAPGLGVGVPIKQPETNKAIPHASLHCRTVCGGLQTLRGYRRTPSNSGVLTCDVSCLFYELCSMRLPPLCRYFRFWGVLLGDRGADLGPLLGVSLGSCVDTSVFEGPFWGPGC